MNQGRRWHELDRFGNEIYLTDERWNHITELTNHPEMHGFENELRQTIRTGQRKQDSLNPQKYRYSKAFDNLVEGNTHVVAIVLFRLTENEARALLSNNYIVTAYLKEVG